MWKTRNRLFYLSAIVTKELMTQVFRVVRRMLSPGAMEGRGRPPMQESIRCQCWCGNRFGDRLRACRISVAPGRCVSIRQPPIPPLPRRAGLCMTHPRFLATRRRFRGLVAAKPPSVIPCRVWNVRWALHDERRSQASQGRARFRNTVPAAHLGGRVEDWKGGETRTTAAGFSTLPFFHSSILPTCPLFAASSDGADMLRRNGP